jgi:hypothetical protein
MDDVLARLVSCLPRLHAQTGARYAIMGGLARSAWAAKRSTFDVDILVDTDDLSLFTRAAAAVDLIVVETEALALASADMTRLRLPEYLTGEVRLDVVAAAHPYQRRVIARAQKTRVFGVDVFVAIAEDIIVLKTIADRPQDRADIAALLLARGRTLDTALIRAECADLEMEPPKLFFEND